MFYWRAFWRLSGDRQLGFGAAGPIMFTAMCAYADRFGVEGVDAFDRFVDLIRGMDTEYRALMRDRGEQDKGPEKGEQE